MWWHSHLGQQRIDGLFGALIVRHNSSFTNFSSFYDYDLSEHVIFINDWLRDHSQVEYSPSLIEVGALKDTSILINGRGIHKTYASNNKSYVTPRAVFYVERGYRYRFRIISNGAVICPIRFSIDNHNLTVISSDNHYIDPIQVEKITVYPGNKETKT
jgi:L-ascorbate oxidase